MQSVILGPAPPFRGGIANFNKSLYSTLEQNSIRCKIYSFSKQYPNFIFPGKNQYEKETFVQHKNTKYTINSMNPFSWISTSRQILFDDPNFIIAPYWNIYFSPCLGIILKYIRKNSNIPIIGICHNVKSHEKYLSFPALRDFFINNCSGLISLSEATRNELQKVSSSLVLRTIPHPLYLIFGNTVTKKSAKAFLKLNQEKKYILFFGIVRRYKGLDILLRALSEPCLRNQDITLIIAGEFYDKKKFYINLIRKFKLEKKIIIHDEFIDQQKVKYYFCAADLIVQPYRTASQSGITTIALNFEKPVIVTNVGGLSESVIENKTGYIAKPTPKDIAKNIVQYYEDKKNVDFKNNIRLIKNDFSWNNFTHKLISFYEFLINQKEQ